MKKTKKVRSDLRKFDIAVERVKKEKYLLKLYVTGMTPLSTRAINNLNEICEKHLKGRYNLEIVDLYKTPELAKGEQIIASPTLIKKLPLPLRRIIGDMSNMEHVLVGLDLKTLNKN